jgi:linalool dehydratase/isomerase-like protein
MSASRRDFVKQVGAAATALRVMGNSAVEQDPVLPLGPEPSSRFPTLNRRTRGWLRFLWDKATTPDDWSSGGVPHQWWDVYTNPVVNSYGRFDLQASANALLLMADQTPAWREVYTRIADGLASRFPTYWGAIDWLTQIGDDPKRARYPDRDMQLMPQDLRGQYNRIGWTANGVQPWGLQRDPIGADGYLFFRGWFNLVLSVYKYVSGDDKWERPFMVTGYGDEQFEWDHSRIADLLERQYSQHPEGPHCENTKVWFSCNTAAALGIYLYDRIHNTRKHRTAERFLEYARDHYMHVLRDGKLESVTRYYDPLVDYKLNIGPEGGLNIAFWLVPQQRELATRIYEAAANALGWRTPGAQVRASPYGLIVARELGDDSAVATLSAAAERESDPRFFGDRDERFGWFFRLKETYPRGQQSALMMVAEVGDEGAWTRAFEAPHRDKFAAPTVDGVDFPWLGVYQAWNDPATATLHIGTYAATADRRGHETRWEVVNLSDAAGVTIRCDGAPFNRFEVLDPNRIRVTTTIETHAFEIATGAARREHAVDRSDRRNATGLALRSAAHSGDEPVAIARASIDLLTGRGPACPCCSA